jgi:hypothetical protein
MEALSPRFGMTCAGSLAQNSDQLAQSSADQFGPVEPANLLMRKG